MIKGCFSSVFPSNKQSLTSLLSSAFSQFLLLLPKETATKKWGEPKFDSDSPPNLRLSGHPVFATQMMNVLKILKIWFILLRLWPTHWTCCRRPVFVTSGSSLSTTLTSVSNAFTDFWGLTYFLSKFYQTNQQVSISLLSKIMDFLKVLIESIYCCEEWTMIKNLWIEGLCLSIPCNDFRNKCHQRGRNYRIMTCYKQSFVPSKILFHYILVGLPGNIGNY